MTLLTAQNQDYSKALGIYAPSQEADRWRQVKALKLLLNNEELRQNIATNGNDYVRNNLTWQKISEQKDQIVQNVLTEREHIQGNVYKFEKSDMQAADLVSRKKQKAI